MADDNDIKKSIISINPLQDALSSNDPSAMGAMGIARSAIKKGTSNIAESSAGKEAGKALEDYLAKKSENISGSSLAKSLGENIGRPSMPKLSKNQPGYIATALGESMGLAGAGTGYVAGRMDAKNSSDNNTKDFSDSTNYDAMGNVSGMKIGGQTHIEEAKKRAEQSRMDDYHMEQTEKAIAGVSPQDYDLAQSQPMKTGSYKEGGNIHIHKGHDYIKDLL